MKGAQHLYGSDGRPRRFRFLLGFLSAAYCVCLVNPAGAAWSETKAQAQVVAPAQAECVMEAGSRRILYELNGERTLPMASTTKILTAITVLENCADIRAEFPIPPEATGVEGSSVYLKSGDIYSVEDLLYGLMLRSGNDCAEALALCIGGSMDSFALRMSVAQSFQKSARSALRRTLYHGAGSYVDCLLRHAQSRIPENCRDQVLRTPALGQ